MLSGQCHCGEAGWSINPTPDAATSCNCRFCRRYSVLWAYGIDGQSVHITGASAVYIRRDLDNPRAEFHFCPTCSALVCWKALDVDENGDRRLAVNLRLADPSDIGSIPLRLFDGLETFEALEDANRSVQDLLLP